MKRGFTIGQIAKAMRCHERSARMYLYEVNQAVDFYADNFSELVDLQTVVALCRKHRDTIMGRRLAVLLQAG